MQVARITFRLAQVMFVGKGEQPVFIQIIFESDPGAVDHFSRVGCEGCILADLKTAVEQQVVIDFIVGTYAEAGLEQG